MAKSRIRGLRQPRAATALRLGAGLALAAVLSLAACSTNPPQVAPGPGGQQGQANPGAPAAQKAAEVKVALLVPLSAQGHPGLIGKSLKQAAELALFEREGGNVQLMVKDDKGTPEGARAAAEDAIRNGATLILGPLFAKSVSAVGPVARKANIPVVAFSNDRQVASSGVYLLSFQAAPEVARIVGFAASQGKRRFAALISDDAFGKLVSERFHEAVSRAGGAIVASEKYPASANRILEPMRKISAAIRAAEEQGAPIDALFIPGAQENLEMVARLLPQADIDTGKVKIIGTGGMDYPDAGRDAKLVGAWYPGPDPQSWSEFSQKFAKTYGSAPPRIATLAYDAVNFAIALAGGGREANPYAPDSLTRASGFSGIDGIFRLQPDGTAERGLAILEVQKFGVSVVEPAPTTLGSAAPGPVGSGPFKSIFNFN